MIRLRNVSVGLLTASILFVGCSGDDGAKGAPGEKGEQGEPGAPGAPGVDGVKGEDGSVGMNGADGEDGADGADGQDGEGGETGSAGAAGAPAVDARSLSFGQLSFPTTNAEKNAVRSSTVATLNGADVAIDYHTIIRSNQDPSKANKTCDLVGSPSTCAGAQLAADGSLMKDDNDAPRVSFQNDFSSLLQAGGKQFLVHAFEDYPSMIYVTSLAQDAASGVLTATATKAADLSSIDGLYRSCAGSITPWGTHISAEESQVDARTVEKSATWAELTNIPNKRWVEIKYMTRYLGLPLVDAAPADGIPDTDTVEAFQSKFSAYFYGFAVELGLDSTGASSVKKHYAMGRLGMELAYVMPDQKTVYLTDDVTNGGLFMFVADAAGDLSAGTLYGMRVYQTLPTSTFNAEVTWVNLGHGTDAQIKALLHPAANAPHIKFTDIFETDDVVGDATATAKCNAGFTLVRGNGDTNVLECLKLKTGMELAASRLETRRYAVMKGASAELTKEEGLTFDPDRKRLYVALSDITSSMGAQVGGADHINVTENRCGAVFSLDVGPLLGEGDAVVTEYAAKNWHQLVAGVPYQAGSAYPSNTCQLDNIASPDNVTYLPGYDTLIIGEDTGAGHQNDAMWAYHVPTGELTRILTTPYGSEVTSPYWVPDMGGHGYLIAAVQHPYGESDPDHKTDAESAGVESYIGVIGPFPKLTPSN